jgi:hypothetical protein
MPNQTIFCNTPWYELHIYWDGSLGICCQEDHKLYDEVDKQYNIATMSIVDWFNSEPVRRFRKSMLGDKRVSECRRCYQPEDYGGPSRRLKSNQKSVIFTRTAFDYSFKQSPGYKHFSMSQESGYTDTLPIDMHIDLGNYCNLACKMCGAKASSTIAVQEVKWGIESSKQYLGNDWTYNNSVWESFKHQLLAIPNLNNIHFMGGETLLTNRFENLVDFMIEHKRFDLCFSFVTNGTVFRANILDKLKHFRRVGIEVSIETLDEHNAYQRQGTDTSIVLKNIQRYQTYCNGSSITVALRPAPSILTIGYLPSLFAYALEHQLIIKANLCINPRFMAADILPEEVKTLYRTRYEDFLNSLPDSSKGDYNASDPNNHVAVIREHAEMCLAVLSTPTPEDSDTQLHALVEHCQKWDKIYHLNAVDLYPEWSSLLNKYNYVPSN